ncbi:hypothetical protein O6H91_09G053100 [Diphasiastrum complanatum]|uniref:Uncharacterized protein n=1 Tax=Diphasiastrum complanatum TaxID=34168 RepID=A0ACC2CP47_DIPCM|nr:hypothetical protein O6H91_09G053100 [Diphasiastrum complanatum]
MLAMATGRRSLRIALTTAAATATGSSDVLLQKQQRAIAPPAPAFTSLEQKSGALSSDCTVPVITHHHTHSDPCISFSARDSKPRSKRKLNFDVLSSKSLQSLLSSSASRVADSVANSSEFERVSFRRRKRSMVGLRAGSESKANSDIRSRRGKLRIAEAETKISQLAHEHSSHELSWRVGAEMKDQPVLQSLIARVDTELAVPSKGGLYASFPRPYAEECREVRDLLLALHGRLEEYERHRSASVSIEPLAIRDPDQVQKKLESQLLALVDRQDKSFEESRSCSEGGEEPAVAKEVVSSGLHPIGRETVLGAVVGTILSQNTTDLNSTRAYASLIATFQTWEAVQRANVQEVEDAIKCGGLAFIKASRIHNILATLVHERGALSLEYLRSLPSETIKEELSRFKGVGPKTVACVLMFHLGRDEFPVDTHDSNFMLSETVNARFKDESQAKALNYDPTTQSIETCTDFGKDILAESAKNTETADFK